MLATMNRLKRLSKLNLRSRSSLSSCFPELFRELAVNYHSANYQNDVKKLGDPIDLPSSLLVSGFTAMKEQIKRGERASYILHLHIANVLQEHHVALILKAIKKRIWNVEHYYMIGDPEGWEMNVQFKWTTTEVGEVSSVYYFHDPNYLDYPVAEHTEQLFSSLKKDIQESHPEFGQNWKIECFLVRLIKSSDPYSPTFALRTY